ncbi:MAG TPA: HAD family phosphatase [Kribbellaceae bacterium]|jgi:HAD superfamily hydrolase (TIGR01509 family)
MKAVLWDMDGTLIDTEPVWWRAETDTITRLGGEWTIEDCKSLIGSDLAAAVKIWMARLPDGVTTEESLAAEVHGEVIRALKEGVELRPGALELLAALNADGVPCALVSASYRVMVDAALSHLPPEPFAVTVAGDEVTHGKPHPEPYLTAARLLGVDPRDCVVLEDSRTGVASGDASGAMVVAIPQHVPIDPAPRRVVVESLRHVTPAWLRELMDSRRDGLAG